MSYNISNWTTKRLENFVIPLSALYDISDDLKQRGWRPAAPKLTCVSAPSGIFIEIGNLGEGKVGGRLLFNSNEFPSGIDITTCKIAVSEISVWGEGSGGIFYNEILLSALKQSTGALEAVLVWEGGDSISRLLAEDGKITEENIVL